MDDKILQILRTVFSLFLAVIFLISCDSANDIKQEKLTNDVVKSDSIKNINVKLNDADRARAISIDSLCLFPDTSVYRFILENPNSIFDELSDTVPLNNENELISFPHIVVLSKSDSLEFKLLFYPGNVKGAFSKFILKKVDPNSKIETVSTKIGDKNFKLSHGAYIGMSEKDFLAKYGFNKKNILKNDSTSKVYGFTLSDFNNSFLKRYNMPVYIAKYKFKENNLIEIEFGFEYP